MTPIKPVSSPVRPAEIVPVADISPLFTFLEQAEVCREQAREAARLNRFRSALGLFATASALCRHVESNGDTALIALAQERLQSLSLESTTYGELARTTRRASR